MCRTKGNFTEIAECSEHAALSYLAALITPRSLITHQAPTIPPITSIETNQYAPLIQNSAIGRPS